jgi:hypothetical protein
LGPSPIRPPYQNFRRWKEGGGRREGRGRPNPAPSFSLLLFPSSSGSAHMGGATAPAGCCVSPLGPLGPYPCRGVPDPVLSGTLLVSEYCRPIYQSLPLDHFETPRHVRDLSGTPNNIQSPNHITHIILNSHRTLSVRTLQVRERCFVYVSTHVSSFRLIK